VLKDKEIGKERRGGCLCFGVLNIYSTCVPDHFWFGGKGPQTLSYTKPEKYYAGCNHCLWYSYSIYYLVQNVKAALLGHSRSPILSPLIVAGAGYL